MTPASPGDAAGNRGADASDRILLHADITVALMRRDLQSRFGHNVLGYAWTFVAPLAWFAAIYFAFWLLGRTSPVYTDFVTFVLSGLTPYIAFRYVISSITRSTRHVRGVIIFPSVTREHAIASAAILEWISIVIVYAIVALANYLVYGKFEMANGLHFLVGVGLAWALGVSCAYMFDALARMNETFYDLPNVLLRPTVFLSAVFFVANELPNSVLDVLKWNPLLHAVEYARDGLLFHYDSRVASVSYVLLWIAAFALAGFIIGRFRTR